MTDSMMFPSEWEKFIEDYSFKDKEEVYTNGTVLVPVFRVEQMVEHYFGCKWIPVTERLPEDDLPKGSKVKQIKVLTALKSDNGVRTVRSQMRYRCTWYSDSEPWTWKYSGSKITHWMPLPEPPKGE